MGHISNWWAVCQTGGLVVTSNWCWNQRSFLEWMTDWVEPICLRRGKLDWNAYVLLFFLCRPWIVLLHFQLISAFPLCGEELVPLKMDILERGCPMWLFFVFGGRVLDSQLRWMMDKGLHTFVKGGRRSWGKSSCLPLELRHTASSQSCSGRLSVASRSKEAKSIWRLIIVSESKAAPTACISQVSCGCPNALLSDKQWAVAC